MAHQTSRNEQLQTVPPLFGRLMDVSFICVFHTSRRKFCREFIPKHTVDPDRISVKSGLASRSHLSESSGVGCEKPSHINPYPHWSLVGNEPPCNLT